MNTIPTTGQQVVLSDYTVAALRELLGICEEFLRTAGPAVHAELRAYLQQQSPPADPAWLVDMLGFNQLHLGHQLTAQTTAGSGLTPSDNWQQPTPHTISSTTEEGTR